jgi:hypothetical protein
MILRNTGHSKHDLKYHFVWCLKYRRLAFKGNVGNYMSKIIYNEGGCFICCLLIYLKINKKAC